MTELMPAEGVFSLIWVLIALPLGGLAALRRGTWLDWTIVSLTTLGISLPSYVVASVGIVVLGVKLGWVPTIGWDGLFTPSSIVPIIGLSLAPLAACQRASGTCWPITAASASKRRDSSPSRASRPSITCRNSGGTGAASRSPRNQRPCCETSNPSSSSVRNTSPA